MTLVLLNAFGLNTVAFADGCAGILCRQEIEGSDGKLVKLLRALEDPSVRVATTNTTAVPISFWEAGPSAVDLKAWHDADCPTCAAPPGYDEVDGTVDELQQFVDLSKSLKTRPMDDIVRTWQEWITLFVDKTPEKMDDFDDRLRVIAQGDPGNPNATPPMPQIKGISGWQTELIDIRDRGVASNGLPPCAITSSTGAEVTIDNSPCTINQVKKEEFNREIANTRDFLAQLTDPQSKFYHDLIINKILLPDLPGRLGVYLVGPDKIQNLKATLDTIELIDGVLTYDFTSTFDYFDDYAAHDWVAGGNHGQGTVTITSLELGGSPATNGLITYTFAWSFTHYDVPKPVPTIVPGPVIVQKPTGKEIVSWTSVNWTWTMEQAEFVAPAFQFQHHLEMPKPYTCDYRLENHCSSSACQSGGVCIGLGDCSAVKDQLTPPGVTNPPGLSDTIPLIRLDDPPVDVSCADPPVIPPSMWGCPNPGSPFLMDPSVGCALVTPHPDDIDQTVGCCGGGSGTRDIDDENPPDTGLTISPPRTVNAPATVQSFADGVDAFDAFVNGIPSHPSCTSAAGAICFGSSNADTADEFVPVLEALTAFGSTIETFRTAAQSFSTTMWTKYGQLGGLNPVTYRWKDSQGTHSVAVEVGNFKVAHIEKHRHGNPMWGKACLELEEYKDDTGANTWVTITQQDPSAPIGGASTLWTWNPFGGKVCKQACASYSFDRVGLVDCPLQVKKCP
ncbi:MAG: hypothetical protein HYZ89_00250 [Candidatus Omnitrophica bacterium]|nr:hypothetical protein [Candidatus Omnitrophota bacterium]